MINKGVKQTGPFWGVFLKCLPRRAMAWRLQLLQLLLEVEDLSFKVSNASTGGFASPKCITLALRPKLWHGRCHGIWIAVTTQNGHGLSERCSRKAVLKLWLQQLLLGRISKKPWKRLEIRTMCEAQQMKIGDAAMLVTSFNETALWCRTWQT